MSNLPTTRYRAFSNAGAPISGAKLYFYAAGGLVAQTVYSDAAKSVPHTNPVVADANGWFDEIYLQSNVAYRIILKDASDNTLYDVGDTTADGVYANTLDGSTLLTHVYETANNPNRYGALGDGVADESADLQEAIEAAVANSRSGVVDLMGRTYKCNSAITLRSGLTLRNGTLDFTSCTADEYLKALGTRGNSVSVSGSPAAGDLSISVSSITGIAAGDWIFIYDSSNACGELQRVRSASGTTINLHAPLANAYTAAQTTYREVSMLRDIRLENLVVVAAPAASGAGRVLHLEACERVKVDNVRFQYFKGAAVTLYSCADVQISHVMAYNNSQLGDGIDISDQSRDVVVTDSHFSCLVYGVSVGAQVSTGGTCLSVQIKGCMFEGCSTAGVYAQTDSMNVTIDACTVRALGSLSTYGLRIENVSTSILNCTVERCNTAGIFINGGSGSQYPTDVDGFIIRGCTLRNNGARNIYAICSNVTVVGNVIVGGTTSAVELGIPNALDITFSDNYIESSQECLIALATSTSGGNVIVSGNDFNGGQLVCTAASGAAGLIVSGNRFRSPSAYPVIDINDWPDASIIGNSLRSTATSTSDAFIHIDNVAQLSGYVVADNEIFGNSIGIGILVEEASHITIRGNSIRSYGPCIQIANTVSAGEKVALVGNTVEAATATRAVYINSSAAAGITGLSIAGNVVEAANGRAMEIAGYIEGAAITGNVFDGNDGAAQVYLNGSAAGAINNVAFTGNAVRDGTYGIEATNHALVIHSGNSFYSQATSHQNGIGAGTSSAGGHYIA